MNGVMNRVWVALLILTLCTAAWSRENPFDDVITASPGQNVTVSWGINVSTDHNIQIW